jgi:hypothetical protein
LDAAREPAQAPIVVSRIEARTGIEQTGHELHSEGGCPPPPIAIAPGPAADTGTGPPPDDHTFGLVLGSQRMEGVR